MEQEAREQVRRDAEALINVNPNDEIPDHGYDELRFAGACLSLLAELEQAERELDLKHAQVNAYALRVTEPEARLASVPALVEALRVWRARRDDFVLGDFDSEKDDAFKEAEDRLLASLTVYEQSQGKP